MTNHPENNGNGPKAHHPHHHHILPDKVLLGIGGALLVLTLITVAVAHIDLGKLNFFIAMAVATLKGSLVALFFMNLWYDRKENGVIFATSFVFLAIFIVLTSTDIFFRGDVYVKGPLTAPESKSHLKDPWVSTPQLVANGKKLFQQNCVSCHGEEGKGNGIASGGLNPPPRNFTQLTGWKNGRKPSMIFKTLKEGLAGSAMASFSTLPSDDRWALAQYVLTFNSTPPEKDTDADFAKAGVDIKGGGAEAVEKSIPLDVAMERMAVPEAHARGMAMPPDAQNIQNMMTNAMRTEGAGGPGARIYAASCVQCHGAQGEGGMKVRNLGVYPVAYVVTRPFTAQSLGSPEAFNHVVMTGLPGELMPGDGQLSGAELQELYQYVSSLRAGSR